MHLYSNIRTVATQLDELCSGTVEINHIHDERSNPLDASWRTHVNKTWKYSTPLCLRMWGYFCNCIWSSAPVIPAQNIDYITESVSQPLWDWTSESEHSPTATSHFSEQRCQERLGTFLHHTHIPQRQTADWRTQRADSPFQIHSRVEPLSSDVWWCTPVVSNPESGNQSP